MNSSFSFSFSTSSSYESNLCMRATSEVSDQYYASIGTDIRRLEREFYSPAPISKTGNYYPRFRTTGASETGSCHVSYLARPFYFYNVPSRYGFSKYVTVRKLQIFYFLNQT